MDTTTTPMPRGLRRARTQSPNDAAANQAPEWGPFLHKQTLLCQGSHSAILTTLYIQTHATRKAPISLPHLLLWVDIGHARSISFDKQAGRPTEKRTASRYVYTSFRVVDIYNYYYPAPRPTPLRTPPPKRGGKETALFPICDMCAGPL